MPPPSNAAVNRVSSASLTASRSGRPVRGCRRQPSPETSEMLSQNFWVTWIAGSTVPPRMEALGVLCQEMGTSDDRPSAWSTRRADRARGGAGPPGPAAARLRRVGRLGRWLVRGPVGGQVGQRLPQLDTAPVDAAADRAELD